MESKDDIVQIVVDAYFRLDKSARATARELNIPRTTVRRKLKEAKNDIRYKGLFNIAESCDINDEKILVHKVNELKRELNNVNKKALTSEYIKRFIFKLKDSEPIFPEWLKSDNSEKGSVQGVANIVFSDWHYGEVVDERQVMFANKYNMTIAKSRVDRVVEKTIDLAFNYIANPKYDGIIIHILGDMNSGLIHEELKITGEKETLQVVMELSGVLIEAIERLTTAFGRAFVPCVVGNHGRLTIKPKAKGYVFDNLDYLVYRIIEKHFEKDKRVKFLIPDGEDVQFKVFDWVFRLTHGSQFKGGGTGFVGPSATIIRNNYKKKVQLSGINEDFDLLICGHFHQHIQLSNIICNSSLIGLNEYAFKCGFQAEPPQQAFFITTRDIKIAFPMPILAEEPVKRVDSSWVSWKDE